MKRYINPLMGVLLVMMLAGCRKDLCYNHDEHSMTVKLHVIPTWEQEWERKYDNDWKNEWKQEWGIAYDDLRPEPAEGIRAIVYGTDDYEQDIHLPAEGGRIPAREGDNTVLLYNNDTEYIVFDGMEASMTAKATTSTLSRSTLGVLHAGERTINQPDQLYGCYIDNVVGEKTLERVEMPVEMRPLTYTYLIRYEFSKGLEYVALARGALAGMAESVYLNDGHTGDNTATVLFDCELKDYGVEVQMKCFGVPNFPGDHYTRADGSEAKYTLNLEVVLNNGNLKNDFPLFDVTDQINAQPRGGVIVVSGIEISDDEGQEGSGGFNPSVPGWGDWEDIPLW